VSPRFIAGPVSDAVTLMMKPRCSYTVKIPLHTVGYHTSLCQMV